jgi:hypothetical protein
MLAKKRMVKMLMKDKNLDASPGESGLDLSERRNALLLDSSHTIKSRISPFDMD